MKQYEVKYLWKCLIVIAVMMLLCKFSKGAMIGLALPFLALAFVRKKPEAQLFWLMFLTMSVDVNSYFIPKGFLYGYIQRGSLLMIGLLSLPQFIGQKKNAILAGLMWIFLYIFYMIIPSMTGWWPMVSYLKLFLFFTIFLALLGITNSVVQNRFGDVRKFRSLFLSFAILLIFGSIALIPFPAIGQLSGAEYEEAKKSGAELVSLFKGMTSHSQSLGPVIATIGLLLIADMLFGLKKFDWLYGGLMLGVPYLIYTTSSRTAMGTFLVGGVVLLMLFMDEKTVRGGWRGKVTTWALGIIILLMTVTLCSPGVRESAMGYILKRTGDVAAMDVTFENAISSRQALIDTALDDFKKKPMLGNGFQVDERLVITMGNLRGLPISAPIEKGVWITAILQEGGVIGFIIYVCFVLGVGIKMKRLKYYCALLMFVIFHVTNLGEFTLFSMSGSGGFLWTMVFLGVVMDAGRLRGMRERRRVENLSFYP